MTNHSLKIILLFYSILFFSNQAHSQSVDKAKLLQFEEAITRGEEYLLNKDYPKAKIEYQKALAIDPEAKYPKDKLAQIRKVYTDPADEANYNNAVSKGDQYVSSGNYIAAKEQYSAALVIKPDDRVTREKMTKADKLAIEKNTRLKEYESVIKTADQFLSSKSYSEALKKYHQADSLNPDETYQKTKINEIETILSAQKDLDDRYNFTVNEADEAYMNRDYSLAKTKYQQASKIKPLENYPKSMLERVDESIKTQDKYSKEKEKEDARLYAENRKQDSINAVLETQRLKALKEEENKQAAIAAQQLAEQNKQDSLKAVEEARLQAGKKAEDDRIALESAQKDALQRKQDSIRLDEESKVAAAKKAEEEKLSLLEKQNIAEKQRQDSISSEEQAKEIAANQEKERLLAEEKRVEEEKAKQIEIEQRSIADKEYYDAIDGADRLFAEQDFASSIKLYEKASSIKPAEEYPKNKIITAHNILLERLKNNLDSYNKFIAAGDLAFQTKIFDKAIEEYELAIEMRPEETYPSQMIDKIRKLMEDNTMVNLVDKSIILIDANEQRFSFKPIEMRLRKNNYIVIKAKKTTEKAPKLFINYGKDGLKSGGIVMKGIDSDETASYLVRISTQDMWYRNDNNWITIYPEGGDLEITSIQISQGDIQTTK